MQHLITPDGFVFLLAVMYVLAVVGTVWGLRAYYRRAYKRYRDAIYEGYCQLLDDQRMNHMSGKPDANKYDPDTAMREAVAKCENSTPTHAQ